jgi:DNA-binding winged helix-turn-helix (wHTH) protein
MRRAAPVDEEPHTRLDGLEIDLAARVLRHDDRETHLTPIEFKLLRVLLLHRGRALTHDLLLRRVWGPAWVDEAQTLRVHIANLRRKMRPFERYILTDHGVGYRFADEARGRDRERRLRLVSGSRRPAAVAKPRASLAEHQEARAITSSSMAIGAQ